MAKLVAILFAVVLFFASVQPTLACEPEVLGIPDESYSRIHQWDGYTNYWSLYYGVPEDLIRRVMWLESRGYHWATSPAGAMGLMQVMPFWFYDYEDPYDPNTNIMTGAYVLWVNYRNYGTWWKATQAYFGLWGADYYGTTAASYAKMIFRWNNGC